MIFGGNQAIFRVNQILKLKATKFLHDNLKGIVLLLDLNELLTECVLSRRSDQNTFLL